MLGAVLRRCATRASRVWAAPSVSPVGLCPLPVALSTVRGAGTDTGGTALLDFLTEIGVTGKPAVAKAWRLFPDELARRAPQSRE